MNLPQWPDYEEPVWDDDVPRTPEESARLRREAEQRRRHEADPKHEPLYLPADDPEFPSDDTFGLPEEEN